MAADLQSHIQAALQCITSPSPPDINQAQEALLRWEDQHTDAYVTCLVSLVGVTSTTDADKPSAAVLRLAAALTLKAAIVRRWKDKGRGKVGVQQNLLSEDVKTLVRQSILSLVLTGSVGGNTDNQINYITNVNEVSHQQLELIQDRPLQTNASALLSKIARMDLPLKFHELIPTLVDGIKVSQGMINQLKQQQHQPQSEQMQQLFQTLLYNTMNCLEAILSEISTQRLLVDKKYRNSIAIQHLGSIVESGLIPSLQQLESLQGEEYIQYAILTSRVVSHLMMSSFSKLVEETSTTALMDQILQMVHSFLTQWLPHVLGNGGNHNGANSSTLRKPMKELLHVHLELIVELQQSHPLAFIKYLRPFLTLFNTSLMFIVGADPANRNNYLSCSNKFAIALLNFLSNVVGTSKYTTGSEDAKNAVTRFFGPLRIQSLAQTLLQLMSLHIYPSKSSEGNEDDIDDVVYWLDDPENYHLTDTLRTGEDDVGCAAQNLFLALAESPFTNEVILPWLIEFLTNQVSQRLAVELEGGISVGLDDNIIGSALPLGPPQPNIAHGANVSSAMILQWDAIYTAAGLAGWLLDTYPGFNFEYWFNASLGPCLKLLLTSQSPQLPILRRRIIWLVTCNAHQIKVTSHLNPLGMLASALAPQNDICLRLTAVQAMDALLPQCEDTPNLLRSIAEPAAPALYQLTNDCTEVESQTLCLDLLSNLITYTGMTGGSLSNDFLNTIVTPLSSIWNSSVDQNLLLKRSVLAILSCVASFVGPESCSVLYPLALPMIDDSFAKAENVFLVEEALKIWWTFLRLSKAYDPMLGKLFIRAAELSKDLEHIVCIMRITEHYIILGGANFLNEYAAVLQTVLSNTVGEVRPRGTSYIFLVVEAILSSFPVEGGQLLQSCGVLKKLMESCARSFFEEDKCDPDRVIVLYMTAIARVSLSTPSMLQTLLPIQLASGNTFGEEELVSLYLTKFQVAGNGAHGLLFQKLWVLLLLSFYPPCELSSLSNIVLGKSSPILGKVVYVLKNINCLVISYEVGYDEEAETVEVGADLYEALLQEHRQMVCAKASTFSYYSSQL